MKELIEKIDNLKSPINLKIPEAVRYKFSIIDLIQSYSPWKKTADGNPKPGIYWCCGPLAIHFKARFNGEEWYDASTMVLVKVDLYMELPEVPDGYYEED